MVQLLLALLIGAAAVPPPGEPLRIADSAFRQTIEIEVRDLPGAAAREAVAAALGEVDQIEGLAGHGVAALNAAAGQGPQKIDPRLFGVLERALGFCVWSERAHGPLGRDLYRLWEPRSPDGTSPAQDPEVLQRAVNAAACERLRLDPGNGTAALAAGSAIELRGFAEGWAVDRVVEVLRQRGSGNAFVQLGSVYRGIGSGAEGRGWHVVLPVLPGMSVSPGRLFLLDRALAIAPASDRTVSYVSQRTGLPVQGVVGVLAVTDLALDAQGLAATLLITGPGEGQLRMGSLRPSPSILWFLGSGKGEPLEVEHHWGEVPKR